MGHYVHYYESDRISDEIKKLVEKNMNGGLL